MAEISDESVIPHDQLVTWVVCVCGHVMQGVKGDKGDPVRSGGVIIPDSNGLPTGYIEGPPGPAGEPGPQGFKVEMFYTVANAEQFCMPNNSISRNVLK